MNDFSLPLATRQVGLAKIADFLPRAAHHYGQMRNYDEGDEGGARQHVSGLSPWISRRLVAESEVISKVLATHGDHESECHPFLREVLWRGYWRSYLEHRPSLWTSYRQMVSEHQPDQDPQYLKAIGGQTGIDVFDHWVGELRSRGYLHNHARLWFASLWIHTLMLPWEWGAAWFLKHLLDADPASNTLSWRWVAGLHTKGKAYLATEQNIIKFTNSRLKPRLPPASVRILADHHEHPVLEPTLCPEVPKQEPGVEDGLLLLGDDLSVETLRDLASRPIRAVGILPVSLVAKAFGWGELVCAFHGKALEDTRQRAQSTWPMAKCAVLPESKKDREWGQEWEREWELFWTGWRDMGIGRILVPAPHQGPYREVLEKVRGMVPEIKIELFSRRYDRELVGLGKKGFFDFWNRRPDWARLGEDDQRR